MKPSGARREALLIAILGMLSAFGPTSIDLYLPSLPAIGRALGADAGAVQMTVSAFLLGFGLSQLLGGPLSDRYGRRPLLVGGIVLYVLASAGCARAGTIGALTTLRLVQGVGAGVGVVIPRAMVRDLYTGHAVARTLSLMFGLMAFSVLLAPLAGGALLIAFGWRSIFEVMVVFGLLCLLAVALGIAESHPPERRAREPFAVLFAGYLGVLRERHALGYLLCGAAAYAGMFAFITGSPFVYIELYGVAPQHYGYLFAVNVLGIIAGSWANASLVLRFGTHRPLAVAVSIAATAGLVLLLDASTHTFGLTGLVAPLFFYVGLISVIGANALASVLGVFPERAGTASALFGGMQFGAGALAGALISQWQHPSAVPMAAVIAGAGLSALLALNLLAARR